MRETCEKSSFLGEISLLPVGQPLVHVAHVVREDGGEFEKSGVDCVLGSDREGRQCVVSEGLGAIGGDGV